MASCFSRIRRRVLLDIKSIKSLHFQRSSEYFHSSRSHCQKIRQIVSTTGVTQQRSRTWPRDPFNMTSPRAGALETKKRNHTNGHGSERRFKKQKFQKDQNWPEGSHEEILIKEIGELLQDYQI